MTTWYYFTKFKVFILFVAEQRNCKKIGIRKQNFFSGLNQLISSETVRSQSRRQAWFIIFWISTWNFNFLFVETILSLFNVNRVIFGDVWKKKIDRKLDIDLTSLEGQNARYINIWPSLSEIFLTLATDSVFCDKSFSSISIIFDTSLTCNKFEFGLQYRFWILGKKSNLTLFRTLHISSSDRLLSSRLMNLKTCKVIWKIHILV